MIQVCPVDKDTLWMASDIMVEAATWLKASGKEMWNLADLTPERLSCQYKMEEIFLGRLDDIAVAAMILQWEDKFFWPNIPPNESGFIHKLVVRRAYAGKGISNQMIRWAEKECRKNKKKYLRLDCVGDRPKLCHVYEAMGFKQIDRHFVGQFDTAFYEKKI